MAKKHLGVVKLDLTCLLSLRNGKFRIKQIIKVAFKRELLSVLFDQIPVDAIKIACRCLTQNFEVILGGWPKKLAP